MEYRLKRALQFFNISIRKYDTLGTVLDILWDRLESIDRHNGKRKCSPPQPDWDECIKKLKKLMQARNKIAHANYEKTLDLFRNISPDDLAREYYIAVVDAIILINVGTGWYNGTLDEAKKHYEVLKRA